MVDTSNPEDIMVSDLKLSREEASIYMLLLNSGKMSKDKIIDETGLHTNLVENAVRGLIDKGTCIEISNEYEALNPRFAVVNMYKMMCYANNMEPKRNKTVDQLATMLERSYEDARTK